MKQELLKINEEKLSYDYYMLLCIWYSFACNLVPFFKVMWHSTWYTIMNVLDNLIVMEVNKNGLSPHSSVKLFSHWILLQQL